MHGKTDRKTSGKRLYGMAGKETPGKTRIVEPQAEARTAATCSRRCLWRQGSESSRS
jgi:hypothetical protein